MSIRSTGILTIMLLRNEMNKRIVLKLVFPCPIWNYLNLTYVLRNADFATLKFLSKYSRRYLPTFKTTQN